MPLPKLMLTEFSCAYGMEARPKELEELNAVHCDTVGNLQERLHVVRSVKDSRQIVDSCLCVWVKEKLPLEAMVDLLQSSDLQVLHAW